MCKEVGIFIKKLWQIKDVRDRKVGEVVPVPKVYPEYYVWHDPSGSGRRALRRYDGSDRIEISLDDYENAVAKRAEEIENLEKCKKGFFK